MSLSSLTIIAKPTAIRSLAFTSRGRRVAQPAAATRSRRGSRTIGRGRASYHPSGGHCMRTNHHGATRSPHATPGSEPRPLHDIENCEDGSGVEPLGAAGARAVGSLAALAAVCSSLSLLAVPAAEAGPPPAVGEVITGKPRVVDGDTLVVQQQRIRLFGLDAPETSQTCQGPKGADYPCGKQSTEALTSLVGQNSVECTVRSLDQYGRLVSTCKVAGGKDLGHWMVSGGQAVAYRQYSDLYLEDERAAAASHRGIWAGQFQRPMDYRRLSRAPAAGLSVATAPPDTHRPGCDIKGNIGSSGDKIYHTKMGRYYEATKISEEKGERWFCSPSEAEAAGWRPSRN